MRPKLTLVTALAVFSLAAAGCGGDDSSSDTQEDKDQITALIAEINRVADEKDAQGFCAVMQPSGVTAQFDTQAKCVQETGDVLKLNRADQPKLEIENIEIDGDMATVELKGDAGGAPVSVVKEGGKWYVPLGAAASPAPETSGE